MTPGLEGHGNQRRTYPERLRASHTAIALTATLFSFDAAVIPLSEKIEIPKDKSIKIECCMAVAGSIHYIQRQSCDGGLHG